MRLVGLMKLVNERSGVVELMTGVIRRTPIMVGDRRGRSSGAECCGRGVLDGHFASKWPRNLAAGKDCVTGRWGGLRGWHSFCLLIDGESPMIDRGGGLPRVAERETGRLAAERRER